MPTPPERTALYRLFAADGTLLYVGASITPEARWRAHRDNGRSWARSAVRQTIEWHNSRPEALAAEELAVRTERPRHNGTHNYDEATFDPASWPRIEGRAKYPLVAELMRREINSGRWSAGQRIPPLAVMAGAAGVSVRTASKAAVLLQDAGLLSLHMGEGLFVSNTGSLSADFSAS